MNEKKIKREGGGRKRGKKGEGEKRGRKEG
jgi:hypothetical protein